MKFPFPILHNNSDPGSVRVNDALLQRITDPVLNKAGVELYIKREDLIHPHINGNKWYKLKYNLKEAAESGFNTLLSFGGAYSNHIYALAAAGKEFNFNTIGIIRGERHTSLNPTLSFAEQCGMTIEYVSRSSYRRKREPEFIKDLNARFGSFYLIPEGGTNKHAVKGCMEIMESVDLDFNYICTPCGTGGTLAGLIQAIGPKCKALGFPVLKGADFLYDEIKQMTGNDYNNWDLIPDYHFGGYAKYTPALINFMKSFECTHNIRLDQVYTAKMMYGIYDLIQKNYFNKGDVIIALHTGGLQGRLKDGSL